MIPSIKRRLRFVAAAEPTSSTLAMALGAHFPTGRADAALG
jgi:hypothetical protein